MSGKTKNLEVIHDTAPKNAVGDMTSLSTEQDRTLFFDFLPLDLGTVKGMKTKFQLYTVPGQSYYNSTRQLVLTGADGIIFVADSNPSKRQENRESFQNLLENVRAMGATVDRKAPEHIPLVIQFNKRDLPTAMSIADMRADLDPHGEHGEPVLACAAHNDGVRETLVACAKLVLARLNRDAKKPQTSKMTKAEAGVSLSSASVADASSPGEITRIRTVDPDSGVMRAHDAPVGTSSGVTPVVVGVRSQTPKPFKVVAQVQDPGTRVMSRQAPPPPPPRDWTSRIAAILIIMVMSGLMAAILYFLLRG
jgi:signal recognition particle receptor subunit beta